MVLKILILLVAAMASGCNYLYSRDKFDRRDVRLVEKDDASQCRVDAEELRTVYNFKGIDVSTYKPEEDPDFLLIKRLKSCPFEETAKTLVALRDNSEKDLGTKAKATYLLIRIGSQVPENARLLLDLYAKRWTEVTNRYKEKDFAEKTEKRLYDDRYGAGELLTLISRVLETDYRDAEFIEKVLDLETDGAYSEMMAGICADEFKKNPESFLRIVKTKPKAGRETILRFVAYATPKDDLLRNISTIPKSSDVFPLTKELLKAADKIIQ
jgi:hypothetical protein